jgi:GNAT superfamily N-acetyltransferase
MEITLRPAETGRERRRLLTFPWRVFCGDALWVPPILADMEARLDPARGAWFGHGVAEPFIAWRGREMVGTICCAEDVSLNTRLSRREAVFGFNHYLPDYTVAAALWDHARAWASARGLVATVGPFDLDYEDAYGILLEGFDRPPALLCGHTPPYYREFMARYGGQPARGQNIALEIPLAPFNDPASPLAKLRRVAEAVQQRGRVQVRAARLADWDQEIARILRLLNLSLAVLPDFSPWEPANLEALAREMRPFLDPDLVLFGEVQGEVVGLLLGLPNLNEVLHYANGLRTPWDKLGAAWRMRRRSQGLCVKSILVLPSHWGRGVDALLCAEMARRGLAKGYTWADLSITAMDNPMTPRLAGRLGARIYKRWQVYRLT